MAEAGTAQRVAMVTGGARGIGRAIAADLAVDHRVAVTFRSNDPAELKAAFPGLHAVKADFMEAGAAERAVAAALDHFGRLDVLVLNAGMVEQTPAGSPDMDAHRAILEVNYLAPVALLGAALPYLRAGAAVVAISSVNAVFPPRDAVTYGASKAALNLWVRGMAKELGPRGIRVNAVGPGMIERVEAPRPPELLEKLVADTALGRPGRPEDVAAAVRFLASDTAGFITGEVLTVSGGYRL